MFDWDGGKRRATHVSFLPSVLFGMLADVGRWWERNDEIQTANSKRPGAKKIVIHFDFMPRPYGPIGMVVVALPVIN